MFKNPLNLQYKIIDLIHPIFNFSKTPLLLVKLIDLFSFLKYDLRAIANQKASLTRSYNLIKILISTILPTSVSRSLVQKHQKFPNPRFETPTLHIKPSNRLLNVTHFLDIWRKHYNHLPDVNSATSSVIKFTYKRNLDPGV